MKNNNKIKKNNKKIRVFEAFSGYGGASFGLKKAGIPHEVVGHSEINESSIKLYELNHKNIRNFGDITKIDPEELPDFDLFTGGFPCQAFSSAGKGLGEADTRGTLFYEIIRICEAKQPKLILLENVKGLLTNKHKKTFSKIISELERIGYDVYYNLLNSKDYGIPQNRERVWIFATKNEMPENWKLNPPKTALKKYFSDLLEKNPDKKYYKNERQVDRLIEITRVNLDVNEKCCFDVYNKKVRKDRVCITITEPHHNCLRVVEPVKNGKSKVRKMTEKEHFRFMGFEDGEIELGDQSYAQLCRCAGNGWDVNIVSKIVEYIFKSVDLNKISAQPGRKKHYQRSLFPEYAAA